MGEQGGADARVRLEEAARTSQQIASASRWYPRYLVLMGLLTTVLVVGVEAVFPSGPGRYVVSATWALVWVVVAWWATSHAVHPRGGQRRALIAAVVWLVAYLVVIGPVVRWKAGESVGWWFLAALLMATPFFVAALRERRT